MAMTFDELWNELLAIEAKHSKVEKASTIIEPIEDDYDYVDLSSYAELDN